MVENKASDNKEERTLQTMFEDALQKHPDKSAVIFDDGESVTMVTYLEMQKRANEIATYLDQLHVKGEVVGLYYHPSVLLPTYLIGILQASAAFATIDPQTPSNINKYFIQNVHIRMILVQEEVIQRFLDTLGLDLQIKVVQFLSDHGLVIVEIQHPAEAEPVITMPTKPPSSLPSSSSLPLAYAIHTSGTTGTPKIVKVPHECILPNIIHCRDIFEVTSDDTIFMASPLTFDPSIVEMFMTLSQGASLVIVPTIIKLMPRILARILKKHAVSVLQTTPTLLSRFGQDLCQSQLLNATSRLRILAFGGEVCPTPSVINQWRANGNKTKFFNLYGITEVSSWATCYQIPETDILNKSTESVPLGAPLLDTELELRDEEGKVICSIGKEGKLFIGGKRHCLIDEEDKIPADNMRDTGDVVKLTQRGFVYLGRLDNQIKRQGKRINLCQIQQLAETIPVIQTCSVQQNDIGRLVLCVVASPTLRRQSKSQQTNIIRNHLREVLPEHGIPDEVILLEKLPMTAHGKVDCKKLGEIIENVSEGDNVTKFDRNYLQLLWQDALGIKYPVEEYTKFLQDGGNSISAIYLADSIESWVKKTIPELLDVILHQSFHDVCLLVETFLLNHDRQTHKQKRTSGRVGDITEGKVSGKSDMRGNKSDFKSKKFKINGQHLDGANMQGEDMDYASGRVISKSAESFKSGFRDTRRDRSKQGQSSNTTPRSHQTRPPVDRSVDEECPNSDWVAISRGCHFVTSDEDVIGLPWTPVDARELPWNQTNVSLTQSLTGEMHLQPIWQCDTGKCVDASPLLVSKSSGDIVYIGSHSHKFLAVSVTTGEALWVTELGDRVESSACISKCGQFVVVGCYDGVVYVLDSQNGEINWKYQTDGAVKSSPVVDTQTSWIMVGSHDQQIHCIDIQQKRVVWCLYGGGGSVFSSPVISSNPRILYAATLTGRILAIDPDTGDRKWHFVCPKPIFSSPAVTSRGILYGCVDGSIYHLDHHGNQLWSFATQGPVFSSICTQSSARSHDNAVANDYAVFGSHDHHVYCLSINSGQLKWQFETPSEVYATPFIFQHQQAKNRLQNVFLKEENSQENQKESQGADLFVLVCCTSGSIFILQLLSGQLITQHSLPGELFSSPVAHDNHIIIGCRDDKVYGFATVLE